MFLQDAVEFLEAQAVFLKHSSSDHMSKLNVAAIRTVVSYIRENERAVNLKKMNEAMKGNNGEQNENK